MEKNSVNNKIIHSFREVDLSAIATYHRLQFISTHGIYRINMLRVYACSSPTNIIMLADSAEELRKRH